MEDLKYCYKYPHPAVTADCVIFSNIENDIKVLLIQLEREERLKRIIGLNVKKRKEMHS